MLTWHCVGICSLDDRFIYFSNWLRGDINQYDIRQVDLLMYILSVWLETVWPVF
jgi:hypothetical protein